LKSKWGSIITNLEQECQKLTSQIEAQKKQHQLETEAFRKAFNDERTIHQNLQKDLEILQQDFKKKEEEWEKAERKRELPNPQPVIKENGSPPQKDLLKNLQEENFYLKRQLGLIGGTSSEKNDSNGVLKEENKILKNEIEQLTEKIRKYKLARKKLKEKNVKIHQKYETKTQELREVQDDVRTIRGTLTTKDLKKVDTILEKKKVATLPPNSSALAPENSNRIVKGTSQKIIQTTASVGRKSLSALGFDPKKLENDTTTKR